MANKKLADLNVGQERQTSLTLTDIRDKPVTVLDFETRDGRNGDYGLMDVRFEDGTHHTVVVNNIFLLDALEAAKEQEAFPADATFTKERRKWRIT